MHDGSLLIYTLISVLHATRINPFYVRIERPWLIDNLDEWLVRMTGPAYSKVAIFVDNSGADIVLGVIPFVRELLRHNTKVR